MANYPLSFIRRLLPYLGYFLLFTWGSCAWGNTAPVTFKLDLGGAEAGDLNVAIQLLLVMTCLTLAPAMVMLMTSFTRIVIVLGFVRSALGVQQAPSNQIIIGLSLFLTVFLMGPIWERIYDNAAVPYMEKKMPSVQALNIAGEEMKGFMLKQTRPTDIDFFLGLAGMGRTTVEGLPIRVVIPSFILSELRTAFQMGFLIFIPFIVIDFLVASILMAMGMMMMPPVVLSLPFKLLLFVLVDGWTLVVRSLVESFRL